MPGVPPIAASALAPNVAGALAYLLGLITGVLFLVMEPYRRDRFVRFHAFQSILFTFAWIVVQMGWRIVWGLLLDVSGSLYIVGAPLRLLISLGFFVYWLFVMYQAYQQKEYRIPIIGAIAAQQAG